MKKFFVLFVLGIVSASISAQGFVLTPEDRSNAGKVYDENPMGPRKVEVNTDDDFSFSAIMGVRTASAQYLFNCWNQYVQKSWHDQSRKWTYVYMFTDKQTAEYVYKLYCKFDGYDCTLYYKKGKKDKLYYDYIQRASGSHEMELRIAFREERFRIKLSEYKCSYSTYAFLDGINPSFVGSYKDQPWSYVKKLMHKDFEQGKFLQENIAPVASNFFGYVVDCMTKKNDDF